MSGPATIVLAAGEGSRYGSPKQLAPIEGQKMLTRVLSVLDGFGEPQIVVLGAHAEDVRPAVPEDRWMAVLAPRWSAGPGASLRAGLDAAPQAEAALIVLGDLPWLRKEAVSRVLGAAADRDEDALRAFDGETPGHPLLLRGGALALARSAPDEGMAALLRETVVARVPCDGLGVARDVDLPGDRASAP